MTIINVNDPPKQSLYNIQIADAGKYIWSL